MHVCDLKNSVEPGFSTLYNGTYPGYSGVVLLGGGGHVCVCVCVFVSIVFVFVSIVFVL